MSTELLLGSCNGAPYVTCMQREEMIHSPGDFLDMLAWGGEHDTNRILLQEEHFARAFYDLKTGFAGEVLQKLSNYGCRLAIAGSFTTVRSERFRELMREANKGGQLRFASTEQDAVDWLTSR